MLGNCVILRIVVLWRLLNLEKFEVRNKKILITFEKTQSDFLKFHLRKSICHPEIYYHKQRSSETQFLFTTSRSSINCQQKPTNSPQFPFNPLIRCKVCRHISQKCNKIESFSGQKDEGSKSLLMKTSNVTSGSFLLVLCVSSSSCEFFM